MCEWRVSVCNWGKLLGRVKLADLRCDERVVKLEHGELDVGDEER